jgi:hypothetical protein
MNSSQLSNDAHSILHEVITANRMILSNYNVAPNIKFVTTYAEYIASDICSIMNKMP